MKFILALILAALMGLPVARGCKRDCGCPPPNRCIDGKKIP